MEELIKIETKVIGAEKVNSVNARDLYAALENKKQFTDWIRIQINTLGLEENIDYIKTTSKVKAGKGTSIQTNYIITTDVAKHISMASRTPKGKEVRTYFIQAEKKLRELTCNPDYMDIIEKLQAGMKIQADALGVMASSFDKLSNYVWDSKFDLAMRLDSFGNILLKDLDERTLNPDMLDEVKATVQTRAKLLSEKHDLSLADTKRLIFGKINSEFDVDTYYKIEEVEYNNVIFFINHLEMAGGCRLYKKWEPYIPWKKRI